MHTRPDALAPSPCHANGCDGRDGAREAAPSGSLGIAVSAWAARSKREDVQGSKASALKGPRAATEHLAVPRAGRVSGDGETTVDGQNGAGDVGGSDHVANRVGDLVGSPDPPGRDAARDVVELRLALLGGQE